MLTKPEFSREIFEKSSNIKFHKNPSSGSCVVPCGQVDGQMDRHTDTMKLIVPFQNFVNKNGSLIQAEASEGLQAFSFLYISCVSCSNPITSWQIWCVYILSSHGIQFALLLYWAHERNPQNKNKLSEKELWWW
jgi:hypothetical protein